MKDLLVYVFVRPGKVRRLYDFIVHFNNLKMTQSGKGYVTTRLMMDALKDVVLSTGRRVSSVDESKALRPVLSLSPKTMHISQAIEHCHPLPEGAEALDATDFSQALSELAEVTQGQIEISHGNIL